MADRRHSGCCSVVAAAIKTFNVAVCSSSVPPCFFGSLSDVRPMELLAKAGMGIGNLFLHGEKARFRGISAETVGKAMLGASRTGRKSFTRYTHDDIVRLAGWEKPLYKPPVAKRDDD